MGEVVNIRPQSEQEIISKFDGQLKNQLLLKRSMIVGGGVLALVGTLPLLLMAVQAGLALVALGGLALVGIFAKFRLPVWIMQIENRAREAIQSEKNRHIAALKAEAKKNPIEQAENELIRRTDQYNKAKAAIGAIGAKVSAFEDKLTKNKQKNPTMDFSSEQRALEKMRQFYEAKKGTLTSANTALAELRKAIDQAKIKWDFAKDANDAFAAMSATDKDAILGGILTEVAFDSVTEEFGKIFAKLDVEATELSDKSALTFDNSKLDIADISIPHDPVPVAAKR